MLNAKLCRMSVVFMLVTCVGRIAVNAALYMQQQEM